MNHCLSVWEHMDGESEERMERRESEGPEEPDSFTAINNEAELQ